MNVYVHCPCWRLKDAYERHGGVRALHHLVDELENRHTRAIHVGTHPVTNHTDDLHVWPEGETASGDQTVVWLLAPNDRPDATHKWEPWFNARVPVLQVDITDTGLFYPPEDGRQRSGVLKYEGKNEPRPVIRGYDDAIEITREPRWPKERFEIAELLRSSELLVTSDPWTAMALEAALCGCPTLFVGNAAKLRLTHGLSIVGSHGYAYSEAELDVARERVEDAYDRYHDIALPKMDASIDRFVEALP